MWYNVNIYYATRETFTCTLQVTRNDHPEQKTPTSQKVTKQKVTPEVMIHLSRYEKPFKENRK
jgi:hypothetical protein